MIIAVEGPDGCGKTTVSGMLASLLHAYRQPFPDRTTPVGRLIDECLRGIRVGVGGADAALMHQVLQVMNRIERLPLLMKYRGTLGSYLVLDRYVESGYVYGELDGLNPEHLRLLNRPLPAADLNVLISVDAATCWQRIEARGASLERYERRGAGFLDHVVSVYRQIWDVRHAGDPRWLMVDGKQPPEATALSIQRYIRLQYGTTTTGV